MSDAISRQYVLDGLEQFRPVKPKREETSMEAVNRVAWECAINCAEAFVRAAKPDKTCDYWDSESNYCALHRPSAQPERKTGRWERHYSRPNVYADLWWHCSVCGYKNDDQFAYRYHHFCPNCGCRMMEVEHETD